jgi:hypothetical protein
MRRQQACCKASAQLRQQANPAAQTNMFAYIAEAAA